MTGAESREKCLALVSAFRQGDAPAVNKILDEFYADPEGLNDLASTLGAVVNVLIEQLARKQDLSPEETWKNFCAAVVTAR